jgi:hypothetical protein
MEVRIAQQPGWPFEYSISDGLVVDVSGCDPEELPETDMDGRRFVDEHEPKEILYLAEGNQIGYLPGVVSSAIGWR